MPRIIDHDARRRQILNDSLILFSEQGYSGLGMRHLAKSLGVSTGTLYHYFPNKPALFEAMLRHLAADNVAEAIGQVDPSMSLETRLAIFQAFIEGHVGHIRQVLWVAIDYRRTTGEEAAPLIVEVLSVYNGAIAAQLTDGDMDRAEALLSYVFGVLVHTGLQHKSGPLFSDLGAVLHAVR
jgi:AcrR family transcriptional regulator